MKSASKIYTALIFIFLFAPIAILLVFSFNDSNSLSVMSGFTLKWYKELLRDDVTLAPGVAVVLGNTEEGVPLTGGADDESVLKTDESGVHSEGGDLLGGAPSLTVIIGVGMVQGAVHLVSLGSHGAEHVAAAEIQKLCLAEALSVGSEGVCLAVCHGWRFRYVEHWG